MIIEPVLGHEARGFAPPFDGAAPGDGDDYAHLATGDLEPGIQTGFCCSTGGGWAPEFVAHESQLHRIGDDMPDERAVLVEPIAGGIHAALLTWPAVADVDRARRRRARCRHDGARRDRRTAPLRARRAHRRRRPLPHPDRRSRSRSAPTSSSSRTSWAAPCGGWSAVTSSATTSPAAPTRRSTPSATRRRSPTACASPGPAAGSC